MAAAITHFLADNAVDLFLMEDLHSVPGAVIESWSFTGLPAGGTTSMELVVGTSVLKPVLQAGVQYWLGASAPGNALMAWNLNTIGDTGAAFRFADGPSWSGSGQVTGAYQITGVSVHAVPEPGALALLAVGASGLWIRRRRR